MGAVVQHTVVTIEAGEGTVLLAIIVAVLLSLAIYYSLCYLGNGR